MDQSNDLLNKLIQDESFIQWAYTGEDLKWSEWLVGNPDKKDVVEQAKRIILSMRFKSETLSKGRIEYIKSGIEDNIIFKEGRSIAGRSLWRPWLKRAAVISFIAAFTASLYLVLNKQTSEPSPEEVVYRNEKATQKGLKLTTFLPDGSTITLNSSSRISYTLNEKERVVELDGEAFFKVAKDTVRPFKVITGEITTTALGTSFNINGRKEKKIVISLVCGKVIVENKRRESVTLHPGEMATVRKSGNIELGKFEYFKDIAWKDGIFVFRNATFPEITKKLEEWYGVNIYVYGDIREDFHFTASYKNQTLNDVLHGISYVKNFEYSIKGNDVKINFKSKNID